MVTVYQPKGKEHIQYIHRSALRLWQQNYGCRNDDWLQAVKDALETHRVYLITGIKMTKVELDSRRAKRQIFTEPKKTGEIWWRNQETGKFELLCPK
jgi:hypothetical protein